MARKVFNNTNEIFSALFPEQHAGNDPEAQSRAQPRKPLTLTDLIGDRRHNRNRRQQAINRHLQEDGGEDFNGRIDQVEDEEPAGDAPGSAAAIVVEKMQPVVDAVLAVLREAEASGKVAGNNQLDSYIDSDHFRSSLQRRIGEGRAVAVQFLLGEERQEE